MTHFHFIHLKKIHSLLLHVTPPKAKRVKSFIQESDFLSVISKEKCFSLQELGGIRGIQTPFLEFLFAFHCREMALSE